MLNGEELERTGVEAVAGAGLGELERGSYVDMSEEEWQYRKLQSRVEGEEVMGLLMNERDLMNWMRRQRLGLISWSGMKMARQQLDCGELGKPEEKMEWELHRLGIPTVNHI